MSGVPEGIYLETKQSKVGTGHTASRVTFKNYYALCLQGQEAVLHLLDDNLELTGLRESVPVGQVGQRLEYQPDRQANFLALLPKLGARPQTRPAAQPPQTRPAAQPPQTRPAAQPPQTRPAAQAPQTRPAAQAPQTRPAAQPPQERPQAPVPQTRPAPQPPAKANPQADTPWWELTQKGAANLLKKD